MIMVPQMFPGGDGDLQNPKKSLFVQNEHPQSKDDIYILRAEDTDTLKSIHTEDLVGILPQGGSPDKVMAVGDCVTRELLEEFEKDMDLYVLVDKEKKTSLLNDEDMLHMILEEILAPENLTCYNPQELIDKYYNGDLEIQCVDGRSVQRNDKLVIHAPGGELALYGQLLRALDDLIKDEVVVDRIREKFLNRKLGETTRREGVYAHSDTHGERSDDHHAESHDHKGYSYGTGHDYMHFQCGCGHCNLIMTDNTYGYTDREKKILNDLYPKNPHKLQGSHQEKAIVVIKDLNDDGTITSLCNNVRIEGGDNQVFSYDQLAVKYLIDEIGQEVVEIADQEDVGIVYEELIDKWNKIHDTDTNHTVNEKLKGAAALAKKGEVYYSCLQNGEINCQKAVAAE